MSEPRLAHEEDALAEARSPATDYAQIGLRLSFGFDAIEALEPAHYEILLAELRKEQNHINPTRRLRDRVELAGGLLNFCSHAVIERKL